MNNNYFTSRKLHTRPNTNDAGEVLQVYVCTRTTWTTGICLPVLMLRQSDVQKEYPAESQPITKDR